MRYRVTSFFKGKILTNCHCSDVLGENFHESLIALSTYYIILMPTNAIVVFNNYILHLPVWWILSKWSPCERMQYLQECMVHYI